MIMQDRTKGKMQRLSPNHTFPEFVDMYSEWKRITYPSSITVGNGVGYNTGYSAAKGAKDTKRGKAFTRARYEAGIFMLVSAADAVTDLARHFIIT
jgi:hypothetical protein